MLKLGSHVSNNGDLMLEGSIKEALSYGASTFMVYMGAPQNTIRKPLNTFHINEMHQIALNNNISLDDIVVHAPYIINLARVDQEKHQFGIDFLINEVNYVTTCGLKLLVLHPGAATDSDNETALKQIADGINEVIKATPSSNVVICIETMAGKGHEMGRTFEEVKYIIDLVYNKERVGVCLDTCHINDGGYDLVNYYDTVMDTFNNVIGFNYLKVIHVNDSKNELGSHKDRHENFGFGNIGFDTLMKVIYDERFENVPKILETPYIPLGTTTSFPPYKEEIEMIKAKVFNPSLKEDVIKNRLGN